MACGVRDAPIRQNSSRNTKLFRSPQDLPGAVSDSKRHFFISDCKIAPAPPSLAPGGGRRQRADEKSGRRICPRNPRASNAKFRNQRKNIAACPNGIGLTARPSKRRSRPLDREIKELRLTSGLNENFPVNFGSSEEIFYFQMHGNDFQRRSEI